MPHMNRRQFGSLALAVGAGANGVRGATSGSAKIDETLRSGIARREIPAAVGMAATKSSSIYEGAFGTRDSSGTPVRIDSIFAIASMTKAITTVAAMQLVEQGKLTLDEPISKHLPQLENLVVLESLDEPTGKPVLRPAKTPITL